MEENLKTPSDEELFSIYGVASTYAIYTDTDKAKRQKGIAAVRAAVEAPWRAEVERLKARIVSEEKTNEIRNRMDVEIKEALQDALGQRFDSARIFPGSIAQLAEERDDLRAIHREAFLAAIGGIMAADNFPEYSTYDRVGEALAAATAALRQWPAACAERDRVIAELEGGA